MKIEELRPFMKKVDINFKVVEKTEPREVESKLDNSKHRVAESLVGDETGTVLITLWDELIDKLEAGKSYSLKNGFTSLFKNKLRLNVGRYGEIAEATEEIANVNTENKMHEKEFEGRRPPRYGGFGGGRRFGGGDRFGGERRGGFGRRDRGERRPRREESYGDSDGSDME